LFLVCYLEYHLCECETGIGNCKLVVSNSICTYLNVLFYNLRPKVNLKLTD
jgi:hypothetical protein